MFMLKVLFILLLITPSLFSDDDSPLIAACTTHLKNEAPGKAINSLMAMIKDPTTPPEQKSREVEQGLTALYKYFLIVSQDYSYAVEASINILLLETNRHLPARHQEEANDMEKIQFVVENTSWQKAWAAHQSRCLGILYQSYNLTTFNVSLWQELTATIDINNETLPLMASPQLIIAALNGEVDHINRYLPSKSTLPAIHELRQRRLEAMDRLISYLEPKSRKMFATRHQANTAKMNIGTPLDPYQ